MKKIFISLAATLLIGGAALAQEKETAKACCKKDATAAACCKKEGAATAKTKTCCMQPSKAASLRTAAAKPAKKEPATKPAPVKEG